MDTQLQHPVVEALSALETNIRAGAVEADEGLADAVAAAVAHWQAPIEIRVSGRAGSGRTTVTTVLELPVESESEPVDNPDSDPPLITADVVVYVLPARANTADREWLAAHGDKDATVVVLNKADAVSFSWAKALAVADEIGAELGIETLPLIGSLAAHAHTASLTTAEVRSLWELSRCHDATITLSADVFLAVPVATDVRVRRTMLEHWDLFGLDCAVDTLRRDPALSAGPLSQALYAACGLDAVRAALAAKVRRAEALRGGALLDELTRIAARSIPENGGRARGLLEDFLVGDLATELGLAAGMAQQPTAVPVTDNREQMSVEADRWRKVLGDNTIAERRAAARLHHGYLRIALREPGAPR